MRKLLVVLLLLVILGGAVFFVGWIQIVLPANTYAVLFSKTNGWEDEVVDPGVFTWRWHRLIPTNLSVYSYELSPRHTEASVSGALPSGDVYASFLGEGTSFSYAVTVRVGYTVKPEALPNLARQQALLPDDLSAYLDVIDSVLNQRIAAIIVGLLEREEVRISVTGGYADVEESLQTRLPQAFEELQILSVDVTDLSLPDLGLYERARDAYLSYVDNRSEALSSAAQAVAMDQAESARDLDLLEHYGRILDNYPVLLDYFALGRDVDLDPLNLRSLTPPTTEQ